MKKLLTLLLLTLPAHADTLKQAQETGWIPSWADFRDRIRVVEKKEGTAYYEYICIEDSTLLSQWVIRIKRVNWREIGEGRKAFNWATPQKPLTAEQIKICFSTPPPDVCGVNPTLLALDSRCKP